mmetsp:Transcript_4266/g.12259  ORF Transcript_4266/g.12259 Transcript_4266/m.12259 type:complete len:336 (+) Transcript_4266:361-1368(+)
MVILVTYGKVHHHQFHDARQRNTFQYISEPLIPPHAACPVGGLFLLSAPLPSLGGVGVLAGTKSHPNVVAAGTESTRHRVGRVGPALPAKGRRGRRSHVAPDAGGNVLPEHGLRPVLLVLPARVDLDLLVPGPAQQLVLPQQQIALVLVAGTRLGEGELGPADAVVPALLALGKVELEAAGLAVDAGADPLHHVAGAAVGAKQALHVVVGLVTKVLVGPVDLEAGPAPNDPGLETADAHSIRGQQDEVHLQEDVLHGEIGRGAGGALVHWESLVAVVVVTIVGVAAASRLSGIQPSPGLGFEDLNVAGGRDPSQAVVVFGPHGFSPAASAQESGR